MQIREVTDTILHAVPGFDITRTVDTFKAGDPQDCVVGVVTTFTATLAVLRRTVDLGANLLITHEPTYFDHLDKIDVFPGDAVVAAKRAFIEANHLVVWRCHDSWHMFPGDGILTGVARQLGWTHLDDGQPKGCFRVPPTTLADLAEELAGKLGIQGLRVTGDPAMPCRGVALSPGCNTWANQHRLLNELGIDVLVCGESREWETCEYVRDAAAAGGAKGLIVLGHRNSEEAGMAYLADWLRERLAGIPVTFVPAGDPFWHP